MRAMRAEAFGGYQDLKFTDIPSPALPDGRDAQAEDHGPLDEHALSRIWLAANVSGQVLSDLPHQAVLT
jgi:hypothetical protein